MKFLTHKLPNSTYPDNHVSYAHIRTEDRCSGVISEKSLGAEIKARDNNYDQGWEIDYPHGDTCIVRIG